MIHRDLSLGKMRPLSWSLSQEMETDFTKNQKHQVTLLPLLRLFVLDDISLVLSPSSPVMH